MQNTLGFTALRTIATGALYSKILEFQVAQGFEPPPYKVNGRWLVSVIIPALNEEEYLPDLLASIENQTYSPIEVVVADSSQDDSMRATSQLCRDFGATYVWVAPGSISGARNAGARYATGDIYLFIDADCVFSPYYVEYMVQDLEAGYLLAHGLDPHFDGIFSMVGSIFQWVKPRDYTVRGPAIWKGVFWSIGGYDEALVLGEREDLKLGRDVKEAYGIDAIWLDTQAIVGTSSRRERVLGVRWGRPWITGVRGKSVLEEARL